MLIEVDCEIASQIVAKDLRESLEYFERDIELNKSGQPYLAVFDTDREIDLAEMKKMRKALKRVLTYYEVQS
jgi:hypothetical protein